MYLIARELKENSYKVTTKLFKICFLMFVWNANYINDVQIIQKNNKNKKLSTHIWSISTDESVKDKQNTFKIDFEENKNLQAFFKHMFSPYVIRFYINL